MIHNDIEKIIITEEQIEERIAELGAELTEIYKDEFPLAIGVLKGAMPFMTDLMKRFDSYIEVDFMEYSSVLFRISSVYIRDNCFFLVFWV